MGLIGDQEVTYPNNGHFIELNIKRRIVEVTIR